MLMFHYKYVVNALFCWSSRAADSKVANTLLQTPCVPWRIWDSLTSTKLIRCRKNSWASCCLLEENSGCPLLTRDFSIRGEIPFCWHCDGKTKYGKRLSMRSNLSQGGNYGTKRWLLNHNTIQLFYVEM